MAKKTPIGVFDSGIGGLTIVKALKKSLPNESIIYFGDTKHLPYGEKSASAIQSFSLRISEFLIKKQCKAIIIACNSASSVAYDKVKKSCEEIPVFNVIDPVVDMVSQKYNNHKIGIIGTQATIESKIYEKKIKKNAPNNEICSLATPLLAPMIEAGFINEKISKAIIHNYLSNPTLMNINTLILACTHYPLIQKEVILFYNNSIQIIDSANIVANHIARDLKQKNLINKDSVSQSKFYVSNYTNSFEKSARFFFSQEINLTEVAI